MMKCDSGLKHIAFQTEPNEKKKMTRGKEDSSGLHGVSECCMCGDFGVSCEIFQCKLCRFRSQHKYCSNLYPKAASYDVCNWCLILKQNAKEKSLDHSSSSSSSMCRNNCKGITGYGEKIKKIDGKIKKDGLVTKMKKSSSDHQLQAKGIIIKKELATRKRIFTRGQLEEMIKLRRTKSEELLNHMSRNYTFRNKGRRYKLLDEVSS